MTNRRGNFTRRQLLKMMGIGATAGLLAACTVPQPPPPEGTLEQQVLVPTGDVIEGFEPQLTPAEEPVELIYWWGNEYEPALEFTNQVIARFSVAYPNVTVNPVAGQGCDTFVTAAAAGTPPDLFHTWDCVERMGTWARRGIIIALDDYIAASNFPLDDYFEGIMDTCRMDGKIWGMVDSAGVFLLWTRPQLFQEIGQEPTTYPADTDELWEWARDLTERNAAGDITRLGMRIPDWTWEYFTWIANFGGRLWDSVANEPTPQHDGILAALHDLVTQVEFYGVDALERYAAGAQSGAQNPWLTGQTAMQVSGDWTGQSIFDFYPEWEFGIDYSAAPPPPAPEAKRAGESAVAWWSWPWVIPAGINNPDWSWELLRFMLSPEYQINVHAKFKEIVVRESMIDDDRLWWPAADVARDIVAGQRALTTVMPMNPVAAQYSNLMSEAIDSVMRLTMSPEDAMAQVQTEILDALMEANI
jgi:multiple sugar transport system substrate-binding protein